MKEFRKRFTKEYLQRTKDLINAIENGLAEKISGIIPLFLEAREKKRTIFVMGNGGSAATASHFVNDFSKLTICEGKPRFKVVGLTDNVPTLLAWANDTHYHNIFVEQIKNLIEPGDVVVGISGSGNSMNVINAIEYANEHGGVTIGLVGYDGGKLINCAQYYIHIPIFEMEKVEDMHLLVQHLLSALIKKETELIDL